MWRAVTDAVGVAERDSLWDYPDLMPDASDIDDPQALIARLQARAAGEEPPRDAMDEALEELLAEAAAGDAAADETVSRSSDAAAGDDPATDDPGTDDPGTDDPRPV